MTDQVLRKIVADRKLLHKAPKKNDKLIDENAELIFEYIRKHISKLSIDDILEAHSHTGGAPNLIYDDNGNWAISCDGYQSLRLNKTDDLSQSCHVEARFFKNTIRKAVEYFYLDKQTFDF